MLPQSECANQNPLQPLGVKKLKKQNKKCCRRVNVLTRIRCNPQGLKKLKKQNKKMLPQSECANQNPVQPLGINSLFQQTPSADFSPSTRFTEFAQISSDLFELLLRAEICSHRRDQQSCKIFASYKKFSKLDPVGSTVRYEMMKQCTGSVWGTMRRQHLAIDDTGSVERIYAFRYCTKWRSGQVLPMPDGRTDFERQCYSAPYKV